jgi:hypothetical protein
VVFAYSSVVGRPTIMSTTVPGTTARPLSYTTNTGITDPGDSLSLLLIELRPGNDPREVQPAQPVRMIGRGMWRVGAPDLPDAPEEPELGILDSSIF